MIGIIILGHGNIAKHLLQSATLFCENQPQTATISFLPEDSPDELYLEIGKVCRELDTGEGVLALADLNGGTPANQCRRLSMEGMNLCTVTGVNLPMLLTALLEREGSTLAEIAEAAQVYGIKGIVKLTTALQQSADEQSELDVVF